MSSKTRQNLPLEQALNKSMYETTNTQDYYELSTRKLEKIIKQRQTNISEYNIRFEFISDNITLIIRFAPWHFQFTTELLSVLSLWPCRCNLFV